MATLYYDPVVDVHHRLPVGVNLTTAFYAAPQAPDDARRLYDAACASLGIGGNRDRPLSASRAFAAALVLAREWGLTERAAWLVDAIEASYEPTWDEASGEFTWGMGLDEPYPRGQFNAFLAAAEAAGPGSWTGLSAAPVVDCPKIIGVDFPNMAFSRAEWVNGALHLDLAPLHVDPSKMTSFLIVGTEPRIWDVFGIDGLRMEVTLRSVQVTVPMVKGSLEISPGSY